MLGIYISFQMHILKLCIALLDFKFSTFQGIYQYQSYDCKIKKSGKGGFVYGKG